jgi:uncharacterized membrane protein
MKPAFQKRELPTVMPDPHANEELKEILVANEATAEEHLQQYSLRLAEAGENKQKVDPALREAVMQESATLKERSFLLMRAQRKAAAQADELDARLHDIDASQKKKPFISAAPANSVVDLEEAKKGHFASGLNFYKLFLVFFIGSFAGVVVEVLWCIIKNGYIESRSGLVYGPFNALYGAGALALTLALYKYRNRSAAISFAGGMIVGSALEYVCSWAQETLLGSRSWDYSAFPFNLNGRICLMYSIFWGVLGVLWIKSIYPRMVRWILKIPNRIGKALTWVFVAFMIFNASMTLLSMQRWAERIQSTPAAGIVDEWLDEHFDDARMQRIFANMKFGE